MAIYSISKIQHRRGKIIDLPQPLSAAEFGWAVDSQELFIGNGSVSEGAPAIGNTKILTEHDDILHLISQYQYKKDDFYIVGASKRSLQDRLDDSVTNNALSITPDILVDQAGNLQNALDTLYANDATIGLASSRVVLRFLPGEYLIKNPVYIPSYATIIGAGIDKTIFKFEENGRFIFISDLATTDPYTGVRSEPSGALSFNDQPKYCVFSDFSIKANVSSMDAPPLLLNCVRNSVFNNIRIKNINETAYSTPIGAGIFLFTKNAYAAFYSNLFNNITLEQFKFGIYSYSQFYNNIFSNINADYCNTGIQVGHVDNVDTYEVDLYGGSFNNTYKDCIFTNISETSINLTAGSGNAVILCNFGLNLFPVNPDINFAGAGNYANGNIFAREDEFGIVTSTSNYYPAIQGSYEYHYANTNLLTISTDGNIFRLPKIDFATIEVEYMLRSAFAVRRGTLTVSTTDDIWATQFNDDFTHTNNDIGDIIFDIDKTKTTALYIKASNIIGSHSLTYTYNVLN